MNVLLRNHDNVRAMSQISFAVDGNLDHITAFIVIPVSDLTLDLLTIGQENDSALESPGRVKYPLITAAGSHDTDAE